jgi:hypothetical protein
MAKNKGKIELNTPYEVGDLVVYLVDWELGYVTDYDCRYELTATPKTCDCCTFLFHSRLNPDFKCRHIQAIRTVLGLD